MAILKCKMCGDNIEVSADKTYGTCDSCGSTMTLPKIDDDQRANLFNRANRFRQIGEFDKAIAAYESILNQQDDDAEAHWCVVLSRFGIEYVEDPKSGERIPTCHRLHTLSILSDPDYLAALEHTTDSCTKELYQKEATRIANIQKEIIAISANEKPYDIFICYKESDESGGRTKDSTMAQEIYYQLTGEGYKVFFSRITLESKLGQEYEPYIFSALQSAKVMVVIGSKQEYFNAIWVKNEWSRYLDLMSKDKNRLLIPCYRDMDAYDIPDALSMFQSQDIGKIGFVQDLIRGVKKVLVNEEPPVTKVMETVTNDNTALTPGVTSLLNRIEVFLEDGEWDSVKEYCDKVLDLDVKCAMAYVYLLCAKLECHDMEQLSEQPSQFDQNKDYQKAVRYGDTTLKTRLAGFNNTIAERIEENRNASGYNTAIKYKQKGMYNEAMKFFLDLSDYKDTKAQIETCKEEITERIYQDATQLKHTFNYVRAMKRFQQIETYKDAKEQAEDCKRLEELEELRREKERAEARRWDALTKKREKKMTIISVIACALVAIGVAVYAVVISPMMTYNEATALMEQGFYAEATIAFAELGDYKDSIELKLEVSYLEALCHLESEEYNMAVTIFGELGDYKDCTTLYETSLSSWIKAQAQSISASWVHTVGLKSDGGVVATEYVGNNYYGQCEVSSWSNIVSITTGDSHTVGLKSDGTVVATEIKDSPFDFGQCDVADWVDIVAISASNSHTVGLKSDGTVVAVGSNASGECDVDGWTDIIAISAGGSHTVGLKSDGTVVVTEYTSDYLYSGQCDVSEWTNITAISASGSHTVGLKSDGTVVTTEYTGDYDYYGQCAVSDWTDIVAISAENTHTVGLKSDGTVVTTRYTGPTEDDHGQCNVAGWENIVAVSAGSRYTIGLTSDGTVIATVYAGDEKYDFGQRDISNWTDIMIYN